MINFVRCVLTLKQKIDPLSYNKVIVYMVCCKKFLKGYVRTVSVEKLIKRLEAYYLFCFDDVDDSVCCSLREDDFFNEVNYYCIPCQHTVLFEFSKKLHVFSAINFS